VKTTPMEQSMHHTLAEGVRSVAKENAEKATQVK
jgi:hypothetical protein